MRTIKNWKAWYKDGTSYESDWDNLPTTGMVLLAVKFRDGHSETHEGDCFFLVPRESDFIAGASGDWQGILRLFPQVKFGDWTTVEHMEQVRRQAAEWMHGA